MCQRAAHRTRLALLQSGCQYPRLFVEIRPVLSLIKSLFSSRFLCTLLILCGRLFIFRMEFFQLRNIASQLFNILFPA